MKKHMLLFMPLLLLFACNKGNTENTGSAETANTATSTASADSAGIADAIHGFYGWYSAFSSDESKNTGFTDNKGGPLKVDQTKFDAYFGHFKNSGFVSGDFIANEAAYYKDCETLWAKEEEGDVPSCMEADRYMCSQDEVDLGFYTKSPVKIITLAGDRATALIEADETGPSLSFELKKEGGKWLLVKAGCAE